MTTTAHAAPAIGVAQLRKALASGAPPLLIDVRTPGEYHSVHVPGARLMPLDAMVPERDLGPSERGRPIALICQSGARARKAAEKLAAAGVAECSVVEGGTQAWLDAGFPVERGARSVLPLDRQLQIAVGSLVLAGVLLSVAVHPGFVWLSAFVGAGLIFAGVTGICALRMVIAAMPWNRAPGGSCSAGGGCCGGGAA